MSRPTWSYSTPLPYNGVSTPEGVEVKRFEDEQGCTTGYVVQSTAGDKYVEADNDGNVSIAALYAAIPA